MSNTVRRLLGIGFDGKPIYARGHTHSLLLSAAGGGKTTCGAMPWLLSLLADTSRAIVITDSKEGEIAAQAADLCAMHGRKVAIVDDFGRLDRVWSGGNPYKISLNRFGSLVSAHTNHPREFVFSSENAMRALIEEPPRDERNAYWRDEPRTLIEFGIGSLLKRNANLAVPGGVWSILSDPALLLEVAEIEAEEGNEYLKSLARRVRGMAKNEEHFPQHLSAALKALRPYAAGSALHEAGANPTRTHQQLIQDRYVVFLVGPVRYMERLGADYALQLQSFMEVILRGGSAPVSFIMDEFTNAPLQALTAQLTTMRGYGASCHMIAQSRSEIQRKYGDKETETIEENSVIKQWFGFSSFDEAERVSRAIGEVQSVSSSLSLQGDRYDLGRSYSTGKERLFTPDLLMRLPGDEQIIHVKDVGFIHCRKVRQNELAPYCYDLAPNPLEGSPLKPSPKITL